MKLLKTIFLNSSIFIFLSSCGGSGDVNTSMANVAKDTTPVLSAAAITQLYVNDESGDKATIYDALRDYDPDSADADSVGISNIYKLLTQTDGYVSEYSSNCQTEVNSTITIPFYGTSTDVYQCTNVLTQVNDGQTQNKAAAWKIDGSVTYYVTVYDHPDANEGSGDEAVVYGTYNSSTENVDLHMASYGDGFSNQTRITGNASTHTFTIARISENQKFVGAGLSQGTGSFLFKFWTATSETFYCYDATTQIATTVSTCTTTACGNCTEHVYSLPDYLTRYPTEHFTHQLPVATEVALKSSSKK